MKKDNLILKLVAGMLLLMVSPPLLCHAAINQILYMAKYNGTPVFGTDTLGGVTYSTITYGDLINGGEPGMPSLPIDYLKFSVPYNATNFTVTTTLSNNWPHYIDHLLYPCQAPRMMNDTTPVVITLPDTAAYYSGTTYPTQAAWVVDEGFLEGENHIVTVAVMPFQYVHSASSDLIAQKRTVTVKLRYDLSDTLAIYPIVRNDSLLREEGYQLTRSMVVNPSQVKTFAPSHINAGFDSLNIVQGGIGGDGLNGFDPPLPYFPNPLDTLSIDTTGISTQEIYAHNNFPYLIITTNDYVSSLRRLVALKRQKGYNVMLMTLDKIYNNSISRYGNIDLDENGNSLVSDSTDFGKVRQYLRYAYEQLRTKYVLLVGSEIPYYYVERQEAVGDYATDWLYNELNTNLLYQKIETSPELCIGRIIAKRTSQIKNYSDKLLRYELNPGHGDFSYLRRSLYTKGKDFTNKFVTAIPNLSPFFSSQYIINEIENGNYPKGKDIVDLISENQYGFLCSLNHGGKKYIKTYGADTAGVQYFIWALDTIKNYDMHETNNGLNSISNKYYPMVYYSLACSTMPYNYDKTCFGESFLTGKDYGGVVYIGNTFTSYDEPSVELLNNFADSLQSCNYKIALAHMRAKTTDFFERNSSVAKVHNFLGDPSIELWTNELQGYSNINVCRTDSSMTITGIHVPSTIVGYFNNNLTSQADTVSTDSVIIKTNPNYPVMLYKHNYIPYIVPLVLQNARFVGSQYVIASDVIAGYSVEKGRTNGNVIIENGATYEIEASGEVRLNGGFCVEKGAFFSVIPSCF